MTFVNKVVLLQVEILLKYLVMPTSNMSNRFIKLLIYYSAPKTFLRYRVKRKIVIKKNLENDFCQLSHIVTNGYITKIFNYCPQAKHFCLSGAIIISRV